MHAANTLDNLPELTVEQAETWVAALLAEARALRQHDEHLFPDPKDDAALQLANRLRDSWRQWYDEAVRLLQRMQAAHPNRHVAGIADLDYSIARARFNLGTTPQLVQARHEQAERGEVVTIEELRRELRSSNPR